MMKKLLAIATRLLASTAARAQYTFEYGGRTIRIDPDRGTVQIPGVYDNTGKKSKSKKDAKSDQAPPRAAVAPAPATAPAPEAAARPAPAPAAAPSAAVPPPPAPTTAAVA